MRINKYLAHFGGYSRRQADELISANKVTIDEKQASLGNDVADGSVVKVDGVELARESHAYTYLAMNKPTGYVCSRSQQDSSPTIYNLLPEKYKALKTVGRLDKDSSGLIILSDDGDFAQKMTHPKYSKEKIYIAQLDRKLTDSDINKLNSGVKLKDGVSKINTTLLKTDSSAPNYELRISEGRNRQIRRTFGELGYTIIKLNRTKFAEFELGDIGEGKFIVIDI